LRTIFFYLGIEIPENIELSKLAQNKVLQKGERQSQAYLDRPRMDGSEVMRPPQLRLTIKISRPPASLAVVEAQPAYAAWAAEA